MKSKDKKIKKVASVGRKIFFKRIREIYGPFTGVIVTIVIFALLEQALSLISPYIYGKIIDGVTQGMQLIDLIKLGLLALLVFIINNEFLNYYQDKVEIEKFSFDASRAIATRTLEKIFNFSIGQHESKNSGIKKSIIDRGQNALMELAYEFIYQIVPTFLQVLVTVVALFVLAPALGSIILIGLIIFMLISFYSNKVLGDDLKKVQDLYTESDKQQLEFLKNAALIKVNAKEKEVVGEYDENYLSINKFGKNVWLRFIKYVRARSLVSDITRILVLLMGVWLVYEGQYTPGFLVVFLSWSSSAFDRINSLAYIHRNVTQLSAAINNYFVLLEMEADIKESLHPIVLKDLKGQIEYKNIFFKYPSREEVVEEKEGELLKSEISEEGFLKNINISIHPGEKVVIVGHSGAGKSTLVQLLIRAYDPDKGKILIDNNDLKDLSLRSYRQKLGIVPQDVALFDNTLRYNILFGASKDATEENLQEAIKIAQVDKFLKGLERGLDTHIGERGTRLSGGERQRVGIARALVKNPSILIFDEATSSLDVENEALIRDAIEKASKGRTTIIIAHRLSTIKNADKIIVLEKGRIVGEGKHEDLLKTCEPYQKMINIQTVIVGGD